MHKSKGTTREPKGFKSKEVKHKRRDDRQRSSALPKDYVNLKYLIPNILSYVYLYEKIKDNDFYRKTRPMNP